MNAAEPKKRGPMFWALIAGACIAGVSTMCCIGSVMLFGFGSDTSSDIPVDGPAITASADAAERWVIAYEAGRGNFTQNLHGGRWVALFGIEMDIRDRDAIRSGSGKRNSQGELYEYVFDDNGDYALTHVKRAVMGFIATGVEMKETGTYGLSGSTLTLTPKTQVVNDFVEKGDTPREGNDLRVRTYQLNDLSLEPRDHRMEPTGPKFLGMGLSGDTPFGDDRSPFVLQLQRVR